MPSAALQASMHSALVKAGKSLRKANVSARRRRVQHLLAPDLACRIDGTIPADAHLGDGFKRKGRRAA